VPAQLLGTTVMGTPRDWPTHTVRKFLPAPKGPAPRGYSLFRTTNAASGHIYKSRKLTWAEYALLRLLSDPSGQARRSPSFGNPEGFDLWVD
jgi:hypothetical protein